MKDKALKQEPVTWMCNAFDGEACEQSNHDECENPIPLYTTPPKREWIGLTKTEIVDACFGIYLSDHGGADYDQSIAEAIEAKLKEKNT